MNEDPDAPPPPPIDGNHSKVIRHEGGFSWRGVPIEPGDPHQFRAPDNADEPLGFLCLVNAERDRPVPIDGAGPCWICE